MKKIAFFIYNMYTTGGTEKAVSLIANELSKENEVTIFSLYKTADKPAFKLNGNIELINVLGEELANYKWKIPYLRYMLLKKIKCYKIDAFICAGMKYVPITIFARKRSKYIAWEHYSSYGTVMGSVTWWGRKLACKKADKIVVLTNEDIDNYQKLFKVSKEKIISIYNPIEIEEKIMQYDINNKSIISCGRLLPVKGFDMLIDIAKKVFIKHSDWHWDIYGDGPEKDLLQNKIVQYNLENNVFLKGNANNMNAIYSKYSIFVLTSRREGLGIVLNEAHSNKLPIISFDCPYGPRNIVKNNVNGYLVDCFDIDEMSEKINYLIENPSVRKQMSDKTNLDKEKFKIDNIINEWEKII